METVVLPARPRGTRLSLPNDMKVRGLSNLPHLVPSLLSSPATTHHSFIPPCDGPSAKLSVHVNLALEG